MNDPKPQEIDIADFVEKVCEIKLLDYQKTFIRKLYENKDDPYIRLIYTRGRSMRSWYMVCMACIALFRELTEGKTEMREHNLSDKQKDIIAQRNAEHYCKLRGIKNPDKKSEVLKAMRQACDDIEEWGLSKERGVWK